MARCPNCGTEMHTADLQNSPNFQAVYQRMKYGVVTPAAQYSPSTHYVPEIEQQPESGNAMLLTIPVDGQIETERVRVDEGAVTVTELTSQAVQPWSKRKASGLKPVTDSIPVRNDAPIFL